MEPNQPTTLQSDGTDFVTVVSVGNDSKIVSENNNNHSNNSSSFITVLKIGEGCDKPPLEIIEEVLVYRLPGERLGFGLKFEGGTKTAEFVKRLFIQSCAPDSPASRVRSSWGKLLEGDEILEIDSLPVKSMTRIDCVRCLKDSNVVIKLKVRHTTDANVESIEDLPQIISAEKKRVPPPPPPVPPRKIPRKLFKNITNTAATVPAKVPTENGLENPTSVSRNNINDSVSNGNQINRFQSPRNSERFSQRNGHESNTRDRRVSDGSIGPPDPEVYTDLFSQESTCSLSESDDTGSSISTIVDRFGSCPTTTTSSLADSLPSTPTSIQKHLDLNHLNPYDNDEINFDSNDNNYLFVNLTQADEVSGNEKLHSESNSLQPPTCFQDAPLSYGNENVRTTEYNSNVNNELHNENGANKDTEMSQQPPPPPSRTKSLSAGLTEKNKNDSSDKIDSKFNVMNLPRLVDFVPKSSKGDSVAEQIEIMKLFLENEKRASNGYVKEVRCMQDGEEDNSDEEIWQEGADYYGFNWSNCMQLATIGEDEEEASHDANNQRPQNPIVIVESADVEKKETTVKDTDDVHIETEDGLSQLEARVVEEEKPRFSDIDGSMEAPPTCSRQPPDGHEFPDYQETAVINKQIKMEDNKTRKYWDMSFGYLHKDCQSSHSVRDKIAIFSQTTSSPVAPQIKSYKSIEDVFNKVNSESFDKSKSISRSVMSLDNRSFETKQTQESIESSSFLHKRSQSLLDMTVMQEQRTGDRWSLLMEQRRRGLSKLKGLVIPEPVAEDDGIKRMIVDIPEIKNSNTVNVAPIITLEPVLTNKQAFITPSLTTPQWNPPSANSIPKYSPAFKRKGLQIYSATSITRNNSFNSDKRKQESNGVSEKTSAVKNAKLSLDEEEYRYPTTLSLNDAPKSLESITSPTRSDCSFEYFSSSPELKLNPQVRSRSLHNKEDTGRSEDESDNDSAVSSSQSSYISRSSPPASPNHLHYFIRTPCNMLEADSNDRQRRTGSQQELQAAGKYDSLNRRLLKPQSVEAINRKNILASAKCRSGRDLKGGSPLIQRKFDREENRKTATPLNYLSSNISPSHTIPEIKKSDDDTQTTRSIAGNKTELPVSPIKQSGFNKRDFINNKEELLPLPKILSRNVRTTSVTDLRKSFEQMGSVPAKITREPLPTATINNNTSIKPTGSAFTDVKRNRDVKAEQKLDVTKGLAHSIPKKSHVLANPLGSMKTVVLKPEFPGGSVGITLAGGTDYETKEITVHKVRSGSVACKDGRLQKGDRIISINGKSMTGLTHAESVAVLKEKVPQITIVACTADPSKEQEISPKRSSLTNSVKEVSSVVAVAKQEQREIVTVMKDIAGLGFSVEGGKDSPMGDVPLRIKKIFAGGAAEKCGLLYSGNELLAINDSDVTSMSKMDAWNLMRKLPEGAVTLTIRR